MLLFVLYLFWKKIIKKLNIYIYIVIIMAADLLSDEQISDFKDAFTLFDTCKI